MSYVQGYHEGFKTASEELERMTTAVREQLEVAHEHLSELQHAFLVSNTADERGQYFARLSEAYPEYDIIWYAIYRHYRDNPDTAELPLAEPVKLLSVGFDSGDVRRALSAMKEAGALDSKVRVSTKDGVAYHELFDDAESVPDTLTIAGTEYGKEDLTWQPLHYPAWAGNAVAAS